MGAALSNIRSPIFATGTTEAPLPRHRSISSRIPARVLFLNRTSYIVTVQWIDYSGSLKAYLSLLPGAFYLQPTFFSHPWAFYFENSSQYSPPSVDNESGQIVVYATSALTEVTIVCARKIVWSPESHLKHTQFKSYSPIVKTVLLVFNRQSKFHRPFEKSYQESSLFVFKDTNRDKDEIELQCTTNLGSIPKDILLKILEAAAPIIYTPPLKPRLPPGVLREDYTEKEYRELFRDILV